MSFRLERHLLAAGAASALIALCGCGRADLRRTAARPGHRAGSAGGEHGSSGPSGGRHGKPSRGSSQPAGAGPVVAVPLPLTEARAARFAAEVTLSRFDLPGATAGPRSQGNPAEEREAAKCGSRATRAIGGGRSPDFQRGRGLDHESISSGVDVLHDAAAVRRDLEYTASSAGLDCYAKVLGRTVRGEGATGHARVLGLHVATLAVGIGGGQRATGIRITARVGIPGSAIEVRLFADALSLPYGPAELDLYTTSFVQPVAERTQSELLMLLRERAGQHRL